MRGAIENSSTREPEGWKQLLHSLPFAIRESFFARYLIAFTFVVGAFLLHFLLREIFHPFVFLLLYPAVFLSAWLCGFGAGAFATIIASVLVVLFLLPGYGGLYPLDYSALARLGVFFLTGNVFSFFTSIYLDFLIEGQKHQKLALERDAVLANALELGQLGTWQWDLKENVMTGDLQRQNQFGFSDFRLDRSSEAYLSRIHPEDVDRVREALRNSIQSRSVYKSEFRVVSPVDESTKWLEDRANIIFDKKKNPVRLVGVTQDITKHRRAAEQRQELLDRLQLALETGLAATWEIDRKTLRVQRSERHDSLYGYPENLPDWTFDHFISHIHEEDREVVAQAARRMFETGEPFSREFRVVWPDQSVHWLSSRARDVKDEFGKSRFIQGILVDVTKLKETETKLEDALRVRDEFLSIASHELRTPITPMKLQVQGLARSIKRDGLEVIPSQKVMRVLEVVDAQLKRLATLVDDLLDVARIRAGKLLLSPTSVNLSDTLHSTIEQFREPLRAAGCSLSVEIEPNLYVNADPLRVEQVISNFLSNAAKYARQSPLFIRLKRDGKDIVLEVEDHGPGIRKEDHDRVFSRFERASNAGQISGLGLGLYISKEIVEAHGGEISLQSELGKGTCFRVQFPSHESEVSFPPSIDLR